MADIVIINPRFDISFWGMEHCIGLLGKRANLPVACLALLAALVPDHHDVTLIDENVEDIDFSRMTRANLVCLTGMSIQGRRMREILERVRSFGVMTVVGGPLATVEEETLDALLMSSLSARRTRPGRNSCATGNVAATRAATRNRRRRTSRACRCRGSTC